MKIVLPRLMAAATAAALLICAAAASAAERGPRAKAALPAETEGRVIVRYKDDATLMRTLSVGARPQHAQALAARLGIQLTDGRVLGARTQVLRSKTLNSQQLAARLAAQSDVESATVDGRMRALAAPSDPLYASGQTGANVPAVGQWYLRAPTATTIASNQSVLSAINVEPAWAITTGNPNVVVAVLDTGVRFDHPDLTGKLLPGYDFIDTHATDITNDGNARDPDPSDPGDFGCGEATSSWHGTQTAGLIGAATNNGVGMASVGRNVKVLPVRVLGCGGVGYDSDIQAAMLWAAGVHVDGVPDNTTPAKVINLSLGGAATCSTQYASVIAQVNAAGAVVVVAAGNDGLDVGSPANCDGAIAVVGVRHSGTKVGYSDLGPKAAIAAPAGNCVNLTGACLFPLLTTSNSGTTTPVSTANGGAIYTGSGDDASLGTSFSAPLVSGAAALMLSANPALTPTQLLAALKSGARAFPQTSFDSSVRACAAPSSTAQTTECFCTTSTCGAGLLDVGAATAFAVLNPAIDASATQVSVGSSVALSAANSFVAAGRTISSYLWTMSPTTGIATLSQSGAAATVTGVTAGSVVVSLTITDSTGLQTSKSVTVAVTPAPVASSGGGGAMELGWLLGWLASVIGVWCVTPRRRDPR